MKRILVTLIAALITLAPTCQATSRSTRLGTSGLWPSGSTCGTDGCPKADAAQWTDFWAQAKSRSDSLIGVHVPRAGLIPALTQVKAQGLTAVVVTDLGVPDAELADYGALLLRVVSEFDVLALCLGNEIDQDVNLDAEAAQAKTLFAQVKAAKPGVLTCSVFQYERTRALGTEGAAMRVGKFAFTDVVAVTSYPNLGFSETIPGYSTAAAIPANYYAPLTQWAGGRKIAFTEIGWDTGRLDGVNQQNALLTRLLSGGLIPSTGVAFANWFSLYDFAGGTFQAPFTRMGLSAKQGAPRPADATWKSALAVPLKLS